MGGAGEAKSHSQRIVMIHMDANFTLNCGSWLGVLVVQKKSTTKAPSQLNQPRTTAS
jgi:hypothetical protein